MPMGRLSKWKMKLKMFDIIHVTWTTMKAQQLTNSLTEKPIDEEYEPIKTYFHDDNR